MASHRLLQVLKTSKPAFGAWLTFPGTWTARTVASASPHISWLVLDSEHGLIPMQPETAEIVASVAALGSSAPSVLVRIPATGPCADGSATWQIKYVLDAGARGIIVPMVCSHNMFHMAYADLVRYIGIYRSAGSVDRVCGPIPSQRNTGIWQSVHTYVMGSLRGRIFATS